MAGVSTFLGPLTVETMKKRKSQRPGALLQGDGIDVNDRQVDVDYFDRNLDGESDYGQHGRDCEDLDKVLGQILEGSRRQDMAVRMAVTHPYSSSGLA